jgi:phosphoribosylaminoimidazolecarboxamide formyltransferase/IMP cyclohydrolase
LNTKLLGEPDKGSKLLSVNGGLLIQDNDIAVVSKEDIKVVSDREPSKEEIENCLFAWKVCKFVKSNAIVYTKENQTVGIGAGQMSRIDSAQIAASKALERGFDTQDCAMASDAFFSFQGWHRCCSKNRNNLCNTAWWFNARSRSHRCCK